MKLNPVQPLKKQSPRFGVRVANNGYDCQYAKSHDYNGVQPDSAVMNQITTSHPPSALLHTTLIEVWDIGAGDGRQTLPLAKMGYYVTASELSKYGRTMITNRAVTQNISNQVAVDDDNILNPLTPSKRKRFNAAIMARVSPHFSLEELKYAIANSLQALKPKGILILDILTLKPGFLPAVDNWGLQYAGRAHFPLADITNCLNETSSLKMTLPYQESNASKGMYMRTESWGALNDRGEKAISHDWYILEKPE